MAAVLVTSTEHASINLGSGLQGVTWQVNYPGDVGSSAINDA